MEVSIDLYLNWDRRSAYSVGNSVKSVVVVPAAAYVGGKVVRGAHVERC